MASACFRASAWLHLAAVTLVTSLPALAADSVETVQRAASDWAKLRAETVRLQTDWQWQRDTLGASLTVLQSRIATLEQNRDALTAKIAGEAAQSSDLVTKNEQARTGLQTVEQHLQEITGKLASIRPWLPPRLSSGLELAFRSIQDPKLGPAERMQHVVTIFNRCGAFNKSVTFAEEPLALDGTTDLRLLEVVYLGLSHAYALDRAGKVAYLGRPEKDGWRWERRDGLWTEVARLVAIRDEEADPAFVRVPAQVSTPFAAESNR